MAFNDRRRFGQVFQARIDTTQQIRLVDLDALLLNLRQRVHHLHMIRPRNMRNYRRQIER